MLAFLSNETSLASRTIENRFGCRKCAANTSTTTSPSISELHIRFNNICSVTLHENNLYSRIVIRGGTAEAGRLSNTS